MRPVLGIGILGLAACQSWNDIGYVESCEEQGTSLGPDEPSVLGFSPNEVIDAIDGLSVGVTFPAAAGGTPSENTTNWTFTWALDGDAEDVFRDEDYAKCDFGSAVLLPATVAFSSDDGEWQGGGTTVMEAVGTGLDEVAFHWSECSLPVTSAPDDIEDHVADSRGACAGMPGQEEVVSFCNSVPLSGGRVQFQISYPNCEGGSYTGEFVSQ